MKAALSSIVGPQLYSALFASAATSYIAWDKLQSSSALSRIQGEEIIRESLSDQLVTEEGKRFSLSLVSQTIKTQNMDLNSKTKLAKTIVSSSSDTIKKQMKIREQIVKEQDKRLSMILDCFDDEGKALNNQGINSSGISCSDLIQFYQKQLGKNKVVVEDISDLSLKMSSTGSGSRRAAKA